LPIGYGRNKDTVRYNRSNSDERLDAIEKRKEGKYKSPSQEI